MLISFARAPRACLSRLSVSRTGCKPSVVSSRQSVSNKAYYGREYPSDVDTEVTFLTEDGIVRLPAYNKVKQQTAGVNPLRQPLPTWQEQGLCIGASFRVAATNGHNPARRVHISGFTVSLDYLLESVEDMVLSRGGKILEEERQLKSGVHETLHLIVAIPYLWGVPPQLEALSSAIILGGGLVDKVYKQWV